MWSKEWAADKESDGESSRVNFMMIDVNDIISFEEIVLILGLGCPAISHSKLRQPSNLVSAIWRIILLQVSFLFACLVISFV